MYLIILLIIPQVIKSWNIFPNTSVQAGNWTTSSYHSGGPGVIRRGSLRGDWKVQRSCIRRVHKNRRSNQRSDCHRDGAESRIRRQFRSEDYQDARHITSWSCFSYCRFIHIHHGTLFKIIWRTVSNCRMISPRYYLRHCREGLGPYILFPAYIRTSRRLLRRKLAMTAIEFIG